LSTTVEKDDASKNVLELLKLMDLLGKMSTAEDRNDHKLDLI
jgi:hypothetical protein